MSLATSGIGRPWGPQPTSAVKATHGVRRHAFKKAPQKASHMKLLSALHRHGLALAALAWVLTIAPTAPAQAGEVLERIRSSGRIVLAHREASTPLSYVDAQGRPMGYAVDLCLRLADAVQRHLGLKALKVEMRPVSSSTRIEAITSGQADLECGSTTNNAERRKLVDFTVPHFITGPRFLVRADSSIADFHSLSGKVLVSTKGTTALALARAANDKHGYGMRITEVPDHEAGVRLVAGGQADAFLMDEVLLFGLVAAQPDPSRLKVGGKYIGIEPLAIMLSRGDAEFKGVVDAEMKRLIRSREAHALYERWFQKPIPPKNLSLDQPMNHLLKAFWKHPSAVVPD
jgi:glutamate/aspartate transport system substrate-binding protein